EPVVVEEGAGPGMASLGAELQVADQEVPAHVHVIGADYLPLRPAHYHPGHQRIRLVPQLSFPAVPVQPEERPVPPEPGAASIAPGLVVCTHLRIEEVADGVRVVEADEEVAVAEHERARQVQPVSS